MASAAVQRKGPPDYLEARRRIFLLLVDLRNGHKFVAADARRIADGENRFRATGVALQVLVRD